MMEKNEVISRINSLLAEIEFFRVSPYEIEEKMIEDVYIKCLKIQKLFEKIHVTINIDEYVGKYGEDNYKIRAVITNARAQVATFEIDELDYEKLPGIVELSNSEINTIQKLINDCRQAVSSSSNITIAHKQRLLSRLEKLQVEIHKVRTDLDIALASVRDVSDTIEHIGEKAKPLMDRLREARDIFFGKSDNPKQLPAPPKQLPAPSDNEENPTENE